nr:phospho-N-acetylmuramoyl-pentapeptide-transferase homolog isoform X1 [Ipomoea batatas]
MWDNYSIHLHPHRPWPHLPSPTTTSLPPLDDEDDDQRPDFSPVGSPDFHEDLPQQHSDQPHPAGWQFFPFLNDDLPQASTVRNEKTKVWRESDPDRHTCGQTSDQAVDEENHHGDSHDEEEKSYPADDSITVTAHRLTMLGRHAGEERLGMESLNNSCLLTFSTLLLFLVDCCAWKIVRLSLAPFFMMRPFLISAVAVSCVGYVCVPLFCTLRLHSLIRREGRAQHSAKKVTPTMGGLYFIPIGVLVADSRLGFSCVEVLGASVAQLDFLMI